MIFRVGADLTNSLIWPCSIPSRSCSRLRNLTKSPFTRSLANGQAQRGAQLTKVPLFEVLKFRWGSTSSTWNPVKIDSDWLVFINMPGQARPKGRRPEFWLRSQTLAFWVEEVDPQRNFWVSKWATLDNCAHLWWNMPKFFRCHI